MYCLKIVVPNAYNFLNSKRSEQKYKTTVIEKIVKVRDPSTAKSPAGSFIAASSTDADFNEQCSKRGEL